VADWTDKDYEAAVAYLKSLRPVTADEWASMTEEERTRVLKLSQIQAFLDAMEMAAARGETPEQFAADIEQLDLGVSDAQVEQVFEENMQRAYGAGAWSYGTVGVDAGSLWGWRYNTQQDDRVRLSHALLEGATFPIGTGDAFFPPWDFGCRCFASWIDKASGEGLEASPIPDQATRDLMNTEYASPALEMPYSPDLTGIDPRLLAKFAAEGGA
jgi:Phage Mu protein F like protein